MEQKRNGFTLIELLVVVAIIGILSSLLLTNLIGVRQRGRDAQRKADVRQIQSALELYRSDIGGYPASLNTCGTSVSFKSPDTTSTYMKAVPCDPLGSSGYNAGVYYYSQSGGGTGYTLGACLENSSDATSNTTATSPGGANCTSGWYFVVTNP